MTKMSEMCKVTMIEDFGFTDSELFQIEKFMDKQYGKTAKEVLDDLIKNKRLSSRQKIVISYVIGNSVGHEVEKGPTKNTYTDLNSLDVSYFGG